MYMNRKEKNKLTEQTGQKNFTQLAQLHLHPFH